MVFHCVDQRLNVLQLGPRRQTVAKIKNVARPTTHGFQRGASFLRNDFGRRFEQLPSIARDDLGLPDFVIAFYDVIGVHDHVSRSTWLFSSGLPFDDERRAVHARERLEQFQDLLWKSARRAPRRPAPCPRIARSTFAPDDFRRAVVTIKDHIASGDIFQANLSQRWTVPLEAGEPGFALDLFQALVDRSPAPRAAMRSSMTRRSPMATVPAGSIATSVPEWISMLPRSSLPAIGPRRLPWRQVSRTLPQVHP